MQHHLQRLLFFVFIAFLSSSGVHAQSGAVFTAVDLDGMICGITSEQEVVCSTHSFEKRFEPPADLPTATAVATGNSFACALLVSGDIQCWGDDNFGVLDAPTAGAPYKAISAGEVHACAIDKDDAIACWGLSNNERCLLGKF